ncbi:MAG: rod shape-determining protein [Lachnospiraceae bacterium]|nr:rod shape-determining protein [Lachnospiraceae bacterium]
MSTSAFGIDLGTYNIKIYNGFNETITSQKNIIAIQKIMNKKNLFAYGDHAFEMYEKAPQNISVSFPVINGVIADINHMQILLRNFINDAMNNNIRSADYYISVPTDITGVEKRAFYDLVKESNVKARNIYIVEKAIADGVGLDVDVVNSQGILVVNIGYETTEISILSMGGIVLSRLIKIGGKKFDESIRNIIRKEYNLLVGIKTAEKVKIALPKLEENKEDAVVYGRDIVTGLPVERSIPVNLIEKAMSENFETIIDSVRVILERTPPELGADIYRKGIFLTGGSAGIGDLHELIAKSTGLKVNFSVNGEESVAYGLSQIIKTESLRSVVSTMQDVEY